MPLPVPFKSKNPALDKWQHFRVSESELSRHFNGQPQNIGVLLGEVSGGLIDIDLDCAEAVKLAHSFLPETDATFGRASKILSHLLFYCPQLKTTKFTDRLRAKAEDEGLRRTATLCEIRGAGAQTLFPGSTHPCGEFIEWRQRGEPSTVTAEQLRRSVARLAAASLLARYWPSGARHDASLALAGGLLRAGWTEDETAYFIKNVCCAANDQEAQARVRNVVSTASKLETGINVTGWPTLAKLIDKQVVEQVCEWLDIGAISFSATETNESDESTTPRKISQATKLMNFAQGVELFHTTEDQSFATIAIGEHTETFNLRGGAFRDWLAREYWRREGTMPSSQALQDAIQGLSGKARFDNPKREVFLRIAEAEGAIYLDLCDESWRVVCITGDGWTVTGNPPVKFRRTRGMLPLPEPKRGGSVSDLRRFINITDESWPLIAAWMVAAFRPNKPCPVLALHGEHGSAKSTTARFLRSLIDPNKAALRSEPRDGRDLMIAANNGWLVSLDNISRVPTWLSDALCRLATGGGFSTRELYSDSDEIIFDAMRPILINGIEELATRSDLLDRTLLVNLPIIPENKRRSEKALWPDFEVARPAILGALLDALSAALRNVENVPYERLPRMADFTLWSMAAETSLGLEAGTFLATYQGNRDSANDIALEASPVGTAILLFMEDREEWKGAASELLKELNALVNEEMRREQSWPKRANTLSGILKRIAPNLRALGLNFSRGEGRERRKIILEKA